MQPGFLWFTEQQDASAKQAATRRSNRQTLSAQSKIVLHAVQVLLAQRIQEEKIQLVHDGGGTILGIRLWQWLDTESGKNKTKK